MATIPLIRVDPMIKVIKQLTFVKQPKVRINDPLIGPQLMIKHQKLMVGVEGLEPPTSSL